MTEMLAILVPILVGGVGVLGGWLTSSAQRREARVTETHSLIDQLQEDRDRDRERISKLESVVADLNARLLALMTREARWRIHVSQQDAHIETLGGEPLPLPTDLKENHDA